MTWGLTQLATLTSTSNQTTETITGVTAAAGSTVVAAFAVATPSTITGFTASDSAGNIWNIYYEPNPATVSGYIAVIWSVLASALSAGSISITRTGSNSVSACSAVAMLLTGGNGSEDGSVRALASGSSTHPAVTGNAASQAGDLVLAVTCHFGTGTFTEDTGDGWAQFFNQLAAGSTNVHLNVAQQTNSGTAGLPYSATIGASAKWAVIQIAFEAAGGSSAALQGASSVMLKGAGAGRYSAALSARTALASAGRGAGAIGTFLATAGATLVSLHGTANASYRASLAGLTAFAARGSAAESVAARLFARAAALVTGRLRAGTAPPFDQDYALAAKPRTYALAAAQRTFAAQAQARTNALT